jgi:hypothetical protein
LQPDHESVENKEGCTVIPESTPAEIPVDFSTIETAQREPEQPEVSYTPGEPSLPIIRSDVSQREMEPNAMSTPPALPTAPTTAVSDSTSDDHEEASTTPIHSTWYTYHNRNSN